MPVAAFFGTRPGDNLISGNARDATRLASLFYEGILSPEAWYSALSETTRLIGGSFFHQIAIDRADMRVVANVVSPDALHKADEYAKYYARNDERLGVLAGLSPGEFMFDFDHFDARHRSRSPLYAEFLAGERVQSCVAIVLHHDAELRDEVGLLRASDALPLNARERLLLRQLAPEMARAGRLRLQARHLAQRAALGFAALDAQPQALAIVDSHCYIEYCNPAAERYFATHDACRAPAGRLSLADAQAQDGLRRRVADACAAINARSGVLRVGQGERSLSISVLPLRPAHSLALGSRPWAMVVFSGPSLAASAVIPAQALAECLGITPTEGHLANMLARGASVNDFAAKQGCSLHTARTHLRNLLNKTGCRRQRDVIELVRGMWSV